MQYYTIRPVQKLLKDSAAPQISRAALAQTIRQVTKTKINEGGGPGTKSIGRGGARVF